MRCSRSIQVLALVGVLGAVSACGSEAPGTEAVEAPADTAAADPSGDDVAAPSEPPEAEEATSAPEDAGEPTQAPGPETDDPGEPDDTPGVDQEDTPDVDLGNRTGPGSAESPLDLGEPIEFTNWTIENLEVTRDDTEAFREEMGDLAPRPRSGFVFMRVRADFTLTSDPDEAVIVGTPRFDLRVDLIGGSGEIYDDHLNCPSFIDDSWTEPVLSMGESATANLCLHVPEDDLDGARLMIGTLYMDDEPLFMAID